VSESRLARRGMKLVAIAATMFALLLSLEASARAEKLDVLKRYEEALVQSALARTGLTIDAAPEGKTIEGIVVVANDVILPGDYGVPYKIPIVYPILQNVTWANHLHVRTREYIIRQELLFKVGQRYQADLIEESGRNLRAFFILAVARLVVTRGSSPDKVVILVVTKDQWTLRLNTDFTTDQDHLQMFSASISESNIAGRNKTASIQLAVDPARVTIGAGYLDPRIGGSRHMMNLLAETFINENSNAVEGGLGQITVGRPLYSLRTKFGWELDLSYLQDIARAFTGNEVRQISYNNGAEFIPDAYAERVASANLVFTRSYGVLDKVNLSGGFRVTAASYGLPANFPTSLSAGARAYFQSNFLPRSESGSGPFLSALVYRASYVRLQNINTFALSEDFRLGPSASLEVDFVDPIFGFSSRWTTLTANYGATYWTHDNMFIISMTGSVRLEPGVIAGNSWVNETITAGFHEITPRFGPFRFHLAANAQIRRNDLTHTQIEVGSDDGLRGYEPGLFLGNNYYLVNAELRSIALNLWTVHIGGVVFYDGGDAPATLLSANDVRSQATPPGVVGYHQDAGIGIRVLFPQFNKDVLRVDLAFPFEYSQGAWAPRVSIGFGQAF
jgi:outer membrane protein assembly factor BamA